MQHLKHLKKIKKEFIMNKKIKTLIEQLEKITGKKVILEANPIGFKYPGREKSFIVTIPVTLYAEVDVSAVDSEDAKVKAKEWVKTNEVAVEQELSSQIEDYSAEIKLSQTKPAKFQVENMTVVLTS